MALRKPGAVGNDVGWAVMSAMAWSIWTTRNDVVFNRKVSTSVFSNIYKCMSFLSQWKALLPAKRKGRWDELTLRLESAAKRFQLLEPRRSL